MPESNGSRSQAVSQQPWTSPKGGTGRVLLKMVRQIPPFERLQVASDTGVWQIGTPRRENRLLQATTHSMFIPPLRLWPRRLSTKSERHILMSTLLEVSPIGSGFTISLLTEMPNLSQPNVFHWTICSSSHHSSGRCQCSQHQHLHIQRVTTQRQIYELQPWVHRRQRCCFCADCWNQHTRENAKLVDRRVVRAQGRCGVYWNSSPGVENPYAGVERPNRVGRRL